VLVAHGLDTAQISRYEAARRKARTLGFDYVENDQLIALSPEKRLERLEALVAKGVVDDPAARAALLGTLRLPGLEAVRGIPEPHSGRDEEHVAQRGGDLETVEELYGALYVAITQPEIPLEVAEVRVMSLHKSKGLSSPYVFIVGCVEGLIPSRADQNATSRSDWRSCRRIGGYYTSVSPGSKRTKGRAIWRSLILRRCRQLRRSEIKYRRPR
jgi:hypothetical protein